MGQPAGPTGETLSRLLQDVRACTICAPHLSVPPRPVLQAAAGARILIAGQAPGRKVAASGVPFDDASREDAVVWIARAHQLHACRIVLYSAKSAAELEKLVVSSGADGFICKTADEALLRKEVNETLRRSAPGPKSNAPG